MLGQMPYPVQNLDSTYLVEKDVCAATIQFRSRKNNESKLVLLNVKKAVYKECYDEMG